MNKVIDPARALKRMCLTQMKGHRQALIYIAKAKSDGTLLRPIPQCILAEMEDMGLEIHERPVNGEGSHYNRSKRNRSCGDDMQDGVEDDSCDRRGLADGDLVIKGVTDFDSRCRWDQVTSSQHPGSKCGINPEGLIEYGM